MNMKGYCPACEEFRTETGDDAWGLVWHGAMPVCQRCGSIVELREQEDKEDEIEEMDEEEDEEE